eukprot:jgi/Hompol1/4778/HPOL_003876-RA
MVVIYISIVLCLLMIDLGDDPAATLRSHQHESEDNNGEVARGSDAVARGVDDRDRVAVPIELTLVQVEQSQAPPPPYSGSNTSK